MLTSTISSDDDNLIWAGHAQPKKTSGVASSIQIQVGLEEFGREDPMKQIPSWLDIRIDFLTDSLSPRLSADLAFWWSEFEESLDLCVLNAPLPPFCVHLRPGGAGLRRQGATNQDGQAVSEGYILSCSQWKCSYFKSFNAKKIYLRMLPILVSQGRGYSGWEGGEGDARVKKGLAYLQRCISFYKHCKQIWKE